VAWIANRGNLKDDETIDHLCSVRLCANPDHMEPVSMRTNVLRGQSVTAVHARKTHCPRGHPYDAVAFDASGRRQRRCKRCHADQQRAYRQRNYDHVHLTGKPQRSGWPTAC
jgi:hypothetical protein